MGLGTAGGGTSGQQWGFGAWFSFLSVGKTVAYRWTAALDSRMPSILFSSVPERMNNWFPLPKCWCVVSLTLISVSLPLSLSLLVSLSPSLTLLPSRIHLSVVSSCSEMSVSLFVCLFVCLFVGCVGLVWFGCLFVCRCRRMQHIFARPLHNSLRSLPFSKASYCFSANQPASQPASRPVAYQFIFVHAICVLLSLIRHSLGLRLPLRLDILIGICFGLVACSLLILANALRCHDSPALGWWPGLVWPGLTLDHTRTHTHIPKVFAHLWTKYLFAFSDNSIAAYFLYINILYIYSVYIFICDYSIWMFLMHFLAACHMLLALIRAVLGIICAWTVLLLSFYYIV